MHEGSIAEIDFDALTQGRTFHPSPEAWGDQVLYFLLADRFSDGQETDYKDNAGRWVRGKGTRRFRVSQDSNSAVKTPTDARRWREAGDTFVGGTLKGVTGKLGYLQRLGITTLWISPVFKQARWDKHSYHGYAIQNFLEIDPDFGTREDLRELVQQAHEMGIYVLLDVIVNHCTDAFAYGEPGKEEIYPAYTGEEYPVLGFRDKTGKPSLPFGPVEDREAAVWPSELQHPESFTRRGQIHNWDAFPEFEQGDFFALKDLHLGDTDASGNFQPSAALKALVDVFRFWIAYTDVDGFRLDTVKHMGQGATRYFAEQIHEYAQSLGKRNFLMVGEIAGGRRQAFETLEATGLDSALGVDEIPTKMRDVVLGRGNPSDYFTLFHNLPHESHGGDPTWCRGKIVTFFDDHDQIGRPVKARFAAEFGKDRRKAERAILLALGFNVTTLGLPCIYYGTEQVFNGHALGEDGGDRYVREAMFGGPFGSFGSKERHFFNESSRVYKELAKILALRQECPALRRGRQYLREISEDGKQFAYPCPDPNDNCQGIVAWSRLLDIDEVLMALNSDFDRARSVWVTVDADRHPLGSRPMKCLYSTDAEQIGTESGPPEERNGSAVCITVPPGGFVIYS